jgi:hypothetical protein
MCGDLPLSEESGAFRMAYLCCFSETFFGRNSFNTANIVGYSDPVNEKSRNYFRRIRSVPAKNKKRGEKHIAQRPVRKESYFRSFSVSCRRFSAAAAA